MDNLNNLSVTIDKGKLDEVTDLTFKLVNKYTDYKFYIHAVSGILIMSFVSSKRTLKGIGRYCKNIDTNMSTKDYLELVNRLM